MASKTKKQQAQATRNSASLSKATSIDISKSLNAISNTSLQIQGSLSQIQEELIQKHAELQAVDEAITLKKTEMEALHGVDQVLLNIDEAKALHQQHLEEMQKQKDQLEKEYTELQAQREQERAREDDEYNYKLQQNRKADSDRWAEELRVRANQERDRKEAFEKDLFNRQEALRAQENEYQAAIEKAKNYEADVAKEVAKAEAILKNTLTKDFNHEKQILAIQHSTQVEKLQFDNKRLVEAANNLETQVKDLTQQLKDAYAKNVELAAKAVDGAANAKAQADAITTLSNLSASSNGTRTRA